MRFAKKMVVHITKFEMKEALMDYFNKTGHEHLADHMDTNSWQLDYLARQKYWVSNLDGEVEVEDAIDT